MTNYNVDEDDNGDIVVMDDDENIVSNKYQTKFKICSGRCVRKEHYGRFKRNTFTCNFYKIKDTHPLNICTKQMVFWLKLDFIGSFFRKINIFNKIKIGGKK